MIRVENLSVRLGEFALSNVNFAVPESAYAVMMGRTGSGKTTLLECICGLRWIDSGAIYLGERNVTQLKPAERGVGYVPQDRALFPTMTVYKHLSFALEIRNHPLDQIRDRVAELSDLLGIRHLLDRQPQGLSGGESQRVALGRALSFRPQILILDEPLSALDEQTRHKMYDLLQKVSRHTKVTVLHITHSQSEALKLADLHLQLVDNKVTEVSRSSEGA